MKLVLSFAGTGDSMLAIPTIEQKNLMDDTFVVFIKGCHEKAVGGRNVLMNFISPNLSVICSRVTSFVCKVNNLFPPNLDNVNRVYNEYLLSAASLVWFPNNVSTPIEAIVLIGFSRGAATCFLLSNMLQQQCSQIPVYIFANNPVPGNAGGTFVGGEDLSACTNIKLAYVPLGTYRSGYFLEKFYTQLCPKFSPSTLVFPILFPMENHLDQNILTVIDIYCVDFLFALFYSYGVEIICGGIPSYPSMSREEWNYIQQSLLENLKGASYNISCDINFKHHVIYMDTILERFVRFPFFPLGREQELGSSPNLPASILTRENRIPIMRLPILFQYYLEQPRQVYKPFFVPFLAMEVFPLPIETATATVPRAKVYMTNIEGLMMDGDEESGKLRIRKLCYHFAEEQVLGLNFIYSINREVLGCYVYVAKSDVKDFLRKVNGSILRIAVFDDQLGVLQCENFPTCVPVDAPIFVNEVSQAAEELVVSSPLSISRKETKCMLCYDGQARVKLQCCGLAVCEMCLKWITQRNIGCPKCQKPVTGCSKWTLHDM